MADMGSFLKSNELFSGCSDAERQEISHFLTEASFEKGEWIFQEGENWGSLFIIQSGSAEVVSRSENHFLQMEILRSGQWTGELAYHEQAPHAASVRAIEKVEGFFLRLADLSRSEKHHQLHLQIERHLAKKISQHLRQTGAMLVESWQDKTKTMQVHNQVAKTLVQTLILMAVWFNLNQLIQWLPQEKQFLAHILTPLIVVAAGIAMAQIIKNSGYPLSFYGLTTQHWLRHTGEAIIFTIPILIAITFLKWILIDHLAVLKGESLFIQFPVHIMPSYMVRFGIYLLLVPVQELVVRGFLQSCFRNFFQGADRVFLAILTSNLLFEMFHTVKEIWFALATFVLGICWGVLYEEQKSIVGVSVSHILVGIWAFLILDYQLLFHLVQP